MTDTDQQIRVEFDFPVRFTRGLFTPDNPVFLDTVNKLEQDKRHRVLFVVDDNVAKAHPELGRQIAAYCHAHANSLEMIAELVLVPGGEVVKNDIAHVMHLVELVNTHKIDRHSYMAIIGGGAVLDMASFAAAISHRGVRAIRIPTTVLSQDDSAVGVKNGINAFGKKNFIGTFTPPFAVLNDLDFIETLEHRDKLAGMAEGVKVALIRDPEFFGFIEQNAERLSRADPEVLTHLIQRSAEIHMAHIRTSGDPFEYGSARPLDFGHWMAHKLESITKNRLRHGEAVAIGMALDTIYSELAGHLDALSSSRIIQMMCTMGFTLWADELDRPGPTGKPLLLEGLEEFREHLGGKLHITLLREIGQGFEVNEMREDLILAALSRLRNLDKENAA